VDLWTWPRLDPDEPPCWVSRSNEYTDTQRIDRTIGTTKASKVVRRRRYDFLNNGLIWAGPAGEAGAVTPVPWFLSQVAPITNLGFQSALSASRFLCNKFNLRTAQLWTWVATFCNYRMFIHRYVQWRRSRVRGRGSADPPMTKVGSQGYISDPNNVWVIWCWCFCPALKSTFSYLKRTKLKDFDQTFSGSATPAGPPRREGAPLSYLLPYPLMLSDPQYFRRSAATVYATKRL